MLKYGWLNYGNEQIELLTSSQCASGLKSEYESFAQARLFGLAIQDLL